MAQAHYQVAKAIKRGDLVRPSSCEECGASPPPNKRGATQIQAHHHKGCDHPLDVQWLCPLCHNRVNGIETPAWPVEPDPLGDILD